MIGGGVAASSPTPIRKRRTTDAAGIANSTAPVPDDVLRFEMEANSTYDLSVLLFTEADNAADGRLSFSAPSGTTIDGSLLAHGTGTSSMTVGSKIEPVDQIVKGYQLGALGIGTKMASRISATVTCGSTPGTFSVDYAQWSANATASKVLAGSELTATKR